MTETQPARPTGQDNDKPAVILAERLDTTRGSLIHLAFRWLDRFPPRNQLGCTKLYVASVVLTFGILVVVGASPDRSLLLHAQGSVRVPLLYDWNLLFMFLVSFPCLVILAATDPQILTSALRTALSDRTIEISAEGQDSLACEWTKRFRNYNLSGEILGAIIGLLVVYGNYRAYVDNPAGLWITYYDQLLPVGWVFLFCMWLFYAVVTVYVVRNLMIALLLRAIVANKDTKVHILPLHPDKAGGLRPVGYLGLRNQYALTLFGFNVVLLLVVSQYLNKNEFLIGLLVAAVVAYVVVGPIVFMAPLLPFRKAMREEKASLMSGIAKRAGAKLKELRQQPLEEAISKEDEELIDRLRKISAAIDELPVWPFDADTLRKFLTAYAFPIIAAAFPVAKTVLTAFNIKLPFF